MRISYGLRAFGLYFLILGSLLWFTLDNAVERLNDGMRQSAESVIVDFANLLAELLERELDSSATGPVQLKTESLADIFEGVAARELQAKIYHVRKTEIDSTVIVTDASGIVVYDSSGTHLGEDFSRWNDIKLTLEGEYGARTSYINRQHTQPDDPKAMFIAAPIRSADKIVGVVSVAKPIKSLESHLVTESKQLQRYAFGLLLVALLIGYLLSLWFTYALNKIAHYANAMAAGENVAQPKFLDRRLSELSNSVSNLRTQLDGKEYVENYVHSLTHELKTPITGIGGAVELLQETLSETDKERFLKNIKTSNERMSRLVERMLSLAKLESLTGLVEVSEFDLSELINSLIEERQEIANNAGSQFIVTPGDAINCSGDRILISQAIANLLDNALRFCEPHSAITITAQLIDKQGKTHYQVSIDNRGQKIPSYALEKIYERFFSLPREGGASSQSKSTGLGLSFVQEIMKLHHGQIKVTNTAQGVIATLRWPTKN